MTGGVPVQVCAACGLRFFPHRLACSRCGSREFSTVVVTEGVIEETTTVRRAPGGLPAGPVVVAAVQLGEGPRVVARVDGGTRPGETVCLSLEAGAPVAASADASR